MTPHVENVRHSQVRSLLLVCSKSINELQSELQNARAAGGGYGTKGARVAARLWVAKVWGVEQVKTFRTKLQVQRIDKGKILQQ